LEIQITQNQTHTEQLIQAALKEAFSHNTAGPETDNTQVTVNA